MQDDYSSYLDFRAMQRRLAKRFSKPHFLLLHTLVFATAMTATWAYGLAWQLWRYRENYALPVLIGVVWSVVLAVQALIHYSRSAAHNEQRELAVEDEMRQFIRAHGDEVDDATLFEMHDQLNADLQKQGRWSVALLAFGLVNAASWSISALNIGSSWPFQTTLPFAVLILGGVNLFVAWQQRREARRSGWLARLPLRHIFAYGFGAIGLWLLGGLRLINYWDADNTIIVWGVVVLLHIVWSVLLQPLIQRVMPAEAHSERPKRKLGSRLALADDGEVLDIVDESVRQVRLQQPRAGAQSDR
ncbi:MAG TPA: hypothetical protein VKY59_07505 [Spirillospora sp.]|nr:hypothetical protein [Spirillospora sp.]